MYQNFSSIQQLLPKLSTILYTAASFKTIPIQYHCVSKCIKIHSYEHFFQDHFDLVYFQHNGRTAHFPATHIPLALRGPADGLQGVQSHVTLALEVSNIPRERWYGSIIGFLDTKGFKRWQHLEISKDIKGRKTPEDVFTAFANTLEVSTSSGTTSIKCTATYGRESKKPLTSLINASRSWLKNVAIHQPKRKRDANWSYSSMQ